MRATLGIAGIVLLIGSTAKVASSDLLPANREFSIAEDAAAGRPVGQLDSDADAAAVTWSIAHDGHAIPFVIDRRTGVLQLANQALDFERQPRHEFVVRARRPRPLDPARRAYMADLLESGVDPETIDELLFEVAEQRVAVIVTDAPEPPVLAPATLALAIDDDGIGTTSPIQASDPDADDALTFDIIAGDAERFRIDPATGALTWNAVATAGTGSYPLTVRVTDRAGLSDAATFNVEVTAATPAVDTIVADVVPPEDGDTSETLAAVKPPRRADVDPPVDIDPSAIAATGDPETAAVELVAPPPPFETEPQPARSATVAAIPATAAAAVGPESAGSNSAVGFVGHAAGSVASFDATGWLPLGVSLATGLLVGAWLRRRRARIEGAAQPQPFRVVRAAPTAVVSLPAHDLPSAIPSHERPADRPVKIEAAIEEEAAVHQLMASAFQQATGQTFPAAPSSSPPRADVAEPALSELAFSVSEATDPLLELAAIEETPDDDATAYATPLNEAPVFGSQSIDDSYQPLEQAAPELIGLAGESADVDEDGFGTEPYTSPHGMAEAPAAELPCELPADQAEPMPTMYGYGDEHEELAAGYQGLRLSQSSEPSPLDEEMSFGSLPADTTDEFRAEPAMEAAEDGEDPKLQELRRQLSDLFGVPADRPRSPAPEDFIDEPVMEDIADEVAAFGPSDPAPTIDLQPGMLGMGAMPAAPSLPPPQVTAPTEAPPGPASDPVHSWLEYLKQRALEKPGTPSSPAIAMASSYVTPSPAPVAAPVKPASNPAPVTSVARQAAPPPPVRVNKSAMREEISMLRDVANQHSRNVLARRALNQRARITWLLWGTALVVMCFSGLWGVRHDAGGMRLLGWGLLGGAGVALGCCVYGLHALNRRAANQTADDEADELATVEDLEATAVPELMTPAMEQRLREVLEEARNVPAAAETRS